MENTTRKQNYQGAFIAGETFEYDSITNQVGDYPVGSVENLSAKLEIELLLVDVNQTMLYQNWTVEFLIADTCTVDPFVLGDYIGWI